jgi:hypothetical protein
MTVPPLLALFVWIPLGVALFKRYPVRKAILLNFIGGWAVLPTASFTPSLDPFPYWILGASLPSDRFFTKATVTAIAALLGIMLFERRSLSDLKLTFWDLPMAIWCIVPFFSAIANPGVFGETALGGVYQILAWGVPYLLGRIYFSDTNSLRLAARAFVIAGLLYVPICLVEIFTGPQFYAHIYGYEPYRWIGAGRYFGFRPVGFLEDGNQLGIWMATSALIAVWLWTRHAMAPIFGIQIRWVALTLVVTTLACQSGGSIILLAGMLPFLLIDRRYFPRIATILLIVGILAFASLRLSNVVSVRTLVKRHNVARRTAEFLKHIGRGSLGWRLAQEERHLDIALEKPVLGYGDWAWWKRGIQRPWGLWLLAFGMYGIIGLAALETLQLAPVMRAVWTGLARSDLDDYNLRHALAAAILMSAIDNLLNGSMILPLVLVIGGMSTWHSASVRVRVTVDKGRRQTVAAR